MNNIQILPSSFRDPSGFLFREDGLILRQVNIAYKENYDQLMKSGLYQALTEQQLLIPHKERNLNSPHQDNAYKIVEPELIPFISYPYEWCFSQLKHAALTTLKIQKISLQYGMSLKDSSAFNIQFKNGKPVFIDSLSFEKYQEGEPWVAYQQFCQHFLAPLTLMSFKDVRLNLMSRLYIDGLPLNLTSAILPLKSYFKLSTLIHIHLHAKSQTHFAGKSINRTTTRRVNRNSFLGLISNLESAISKLRYKTYNSEWPDYYESPHYLPESFSSKKNIVADCLNRLKPKIVWDLGANTGIFSRIASQQGILTISLDSDPVVVENNYLNCLKENDTKVLPLVIDVTNPSPGIGWENEERSGLIGRGPGDLVMALALVHHLAIGNNLPFSKIAHFFSKIGDSLIIEYIPKDDPQAHTLLSRREDIFNNYSQEGFENEFKKFFQIVSTANLKNSHRLLYLMKKLDNSHP